LPGFGCLLTHISALGNLRVTNEEIQWLKKNCSYLPDTYLDFLQSFRVYPEKQVDLQYNEEKQDISITMHGRWIDTILYEIPILALVSEAYFRFVDTDWDYVGQVGIRPPGSLIYMVGVNECRRTRIL
jgi:nicotinate phosphoribosyltransferase